MPQSMVGLPSSLIRFIVHIPAGIYVTTTVNHARAMAKLPVLHHAPYNPNILPGERLAAIIGCITLSWNFIMWLPTMASQGSALLIIGIVDALLASGLLAAGVLQSTFITHTTSRCNSVAETWQVPPNTPSLFRLTAAANANSTLVISQCKGYQQEWVIGWLITALYVLSAFFSIWLSGTFKNGHKITLKEFKTSTTATFKPIGACFLGLLLLPFRLLACIFLPIVRPPFRFSIGYLAKWRIRNQYDTRLKSYPKKTHSLRIHNHVSQEMTDLSQIEKKGIVITSREMSMDGRLADLPYDLFVLICQNLHDIDIIRLSQTSKQMRELLYDNLENGAHVSKFKDYTCYHTPRSQCWGCGIQVCDTCKRPHESHGTPAMIHLERCKVTCSGCYYKALSKKLLMHPLKDSACKCQRDLLELPTASIWAALRIPEARTICDACCRLSSSNILKIRASRDIATMQKLRSNPVKCTSCWKDLSTSGPRWWICSICKYECRSRFHPAWADRGKDLGRDRTGDDAV